MSLWLLQIGELFNQIFALGNLFIRNNCQFYLLSFRFTLQ
jgi:hypothetical protein